MSTLDICCYFGVYGFSCDPDAISTLLGITPTLAWRAGESLPGSKAIKVVSGWQLNSRLKDSESIGDHVRDVLDQLRPVKERVANLKEGKTPVISCAVYFRSYAQPQVRLKKAMLQEMTEMGVEFDFDLYVHDLTAS